MRILSTALVAALIVLPAADAGAQDDRARVMGLVTDASGGALPGATVSIAGGTQQPAPVITDEAGRYLTPWVPPGSYTVTFVLPGFDTRRVSGLALGPGQTIVLDQQMSLAPLSETVEVRAPAPPPPPPPPPAWVPPPRPQARPVDKEILASVCGPRLPPEFSNAVGKVLSHRDSDRQLLGPGDLLRIDAGAKDGMAEGQNLVVRRRFTKESDDWRSFKPELLGEQTAGLVQIVELDEKSAVAQVVYACGEIVAGDTVERYVAQPAFFAVGAGAPRFEEPARITFGEHGAMVTSAGRMMVIDRGIMQGVQRGQRLTIFRGTGGAASRVTVGTGVIVAVRADSATLRIEHSVDAVNVGDLVALHR